MPSCSTSKISHVASTQNTADMLRAADGHRSPPRYPDGRDFDLCDDTSKHLSQINNDIYDEFGAC